ncbi:MAG: ABC transporter substrate-binding protein [Thermodesulfobacteriota bacterium]
MKKQYPIMMIILVLFCSLDIQVAATADPGVTQTLIKIGSNMILTGPAAFWGQGSDKGARAYFGYINDQGGIHGRKIEFINSDNEYKPVKAVAATKKLIEHDEVFVLMGYQSAACILAAEKVFGEAGVPLIAPITTGRALAEPPRKYLFNVFTQYRDQAKSLIDFMAKDSKLRSLKIAAIYQDDEFGKDGLEGLDEQVKKHPTMEVVARESFARGAKDFGSQVVKCKQSGAGGLLISCAVTEAAMIIKEAEKLAWKPQFMVLSGAADDKVVELAGVAAEGLLAATNVIIPTEKDNPVVVRSAEIIHKYHPEQSINVPAVDGLAVAMITVETLRRAGTNPTRAKVIEVLENMKGFETGVLPPVTFGPNQRQGCVGAYIYQVRNGRFVSIK